MREIELSARCVKKSLFCSVKVPIIGFLRISSQGCILSLKYLHIICIKLDYLKNVPYNLKKYSLVTEIERISVGHDKFFLIFQKKYCRVVYFPTPYHFPKNQQKIFIIVDKNPENLI